MPRMQVRVAAVLFVCAAGTVGWAQSKRPPAPAVPAASEWPNYGHDAGGTRFSPMAQLTPVNVAQLHPAWVYHMKVERGAGGFASGETTPLVINGVMYVSTPDGRVVALDPTTGNEKWVFGLPTGSPSTRGVEYFRGDSTTPPQIVFGSTD